MRVAVAILLTLSGLVVAAVPQPAPAIPSPAGAVAIALADARKLATVTRQSDPGAVAETRYLSLHGIPEEDRAEFVKTLRYHLWCLSKEPEPPHPRVVGEYVLALRLSDYGFDKYVYGRLAHVDPYFHMQVKNPQTGETQTVASPRLRPAEIGELSGLTVSAVPMLRADWFFVRTAIQQRRGEPGKGTGYYDFLGVTSRADFERLVGIDRRDVVQSIREARGIVDRSGVAQFSRQIVRLAGPDSGYWVTLDVLDDQADARDAVRKLGKDYQHQAEEIYAVNPSGLFWFLLSDADGKIQNRAPQDIGPDKSKDGTDGNIDIHLSCIRCHDKDGQGLRPFDDWAKRNLQLPLAVNLPVEESTRLRRQYLRDLERFRQRDRQVYADAVKRCNGRTVQENGRAFARAWDRYVETDRTIEDGARELGVSVEHLRKALQAAATPRTLADGSVLPGILDPGLTPWLQGGTIRVERWEQLHPIAEVYLGQVK